MITRPVALAAKNTLRWVENDRSWASVPRVTFHPSPTWPTTLAWGTRASVMNTSLNDRCSFIWRMGRTSTPGWCMSIRKYVRPACLGTSQSVRATRMPMSAWSALVFHTFWPLTIQSSPSRTAVVLSPARSEPAVGSLNSWHQEISPVTVGRRNRSFTSSDPWS